MKNKSPPFFKGDFQKKMIAQNNEVRAKNQSKKVDEK